MSYYSSFSGHSLSGNKYATIDAVASALVDKIMGFPGIGDILSIAKTILGIDVKPIMKAMAPQLLKSQFQSIEAMKEVQNTDQMVSQLVNALLLEGLNQGLFSSESSSPLFLSDSTGEMGWGTQILKTAVQSALEDVFEEILTEALDVELEEPPSEDMWGDMIPEEEELPAPAPGRVPVVVPGLETRPRIVRAPGGAPIQFVKPTPRPVTAPGAGLSTPLLLGAAGLAALLLLG